MIASTARRLFTALALAVLAGLPAACGGGDVARHRGGQAYNVAPTNVPYKLGKPYVVRGVRYVPRDDTAYDRTGTASWYGGKFHGRKTASGQRFDMNAFTAAHKTLPMGTQVRVTNLANGRSVIVTINVERAGRLIFPVAELRGVRNC